MSVVGYVWVEETSIGHVIMSCMSREEHVLGSDFGADGGQIVVYGANNKYKIRTRSVITTCV